MPEPAADGVPRALDQARQRRVAKPPDQRRRDILDAATTLFHERGFDATTVQTIATSAGVAAGTVYLHFASKEAVLAGLYEDYEAGLLQRFAQIASDVVEEEVATATTLSNPEIVGRLVDGIVEYALERRDISEVIAGRVPAAADLAVLTRGLDEVLAAVIREGVRLGHVHASDPDTAARLLNLAAVGSICSAIATDDDDTLTRTVRGVKELYVKTLAPLL